MLKKLLSSLLVLIVWLFIATNLPAKEFKIATYNVENLFDDNYGGSEYSDFIPNLHNWTPKMVERKLINTAEVICELDADIIALQEIENVSILKQLQAKLKSVGCPYRYFAITSPTQPSAINSALLSRYKITNTKDILVKQERNILEATVAIDGIKLILFVNHWKSKAKNGDESRRVASAKALMQRIKNLPKDSEYIILGDLNSNYDEFEIKNLEPRRRTQVIAINDILNTTHNDKLLLPEDLNNTPSTPHYNLWLEIPTYERWNHSYYGHKSTLDHIILPSTLFDSKGVDYVNNSFKRLNEPFLFTKQGWINNWQYKNSKHLGKGYSDHLPIFALFSTNPYKPNSKQLSTAASIDDLYDIDELTHPVTLEGVSLIFKRGNIGILKQSPDSMAILLYGDVKNLYEGKRYNLEVMQIKNYNGLKEIIQIKKLKEIESVDTYSYFLTQNQLEVNNQKLQNQIFVGLKGSYDNGYLTIENQKIPIYFKKRVTVPPNGSKLNINYAQLGYYHKAQLVIHDQLDFNEE